MLKTLISGLVFFVFSLNLWGQSVIEKSLDFSVTEMPLSDALEKLSEEAGVDIAFSGKIVGEQPVTFRFEKTSLKNILDAMLDDSAAEWRFAASRVLVTRRKIKTITLSGFLREHNSGEPLIGAIVFSPTAGQGTYTNEYGFFSFELPVGEQEVRFRLLGYKEKIVRKEFRSSENFEVDLTPNLSLPDIIINPENADSALMSVEPGRGVRISPALAHQFPAPGGVPDIVSAAGLLPGVQGGVAGTAGLHIRGGDPGHNLMLLDGAPVFIPYHLLGIYSPFNTETLKSVNLVKDRHSARYGGRVSAVMDIRSREGNVDHWEGGASATLGMFEAHAEGPLACDKAGILISGRFAPGPLVNRSLLNRLYFPAAAGDLETSFFDAMVKAHFITGPKDRLYLSLFQSGDIVRKEYEEGNRGLIYEMESALDWQNTTATLRWNHLFSEKAFLNTTLSHSFFRFGYTTLDQLVQRDTTLQNLLFFANSSSENHISSLTSDLDLRVGARHKVRLGAGLSIPFLRPVVNVLDQDSDSIISGTGVAAADLVGDSEGEWNEVLEGFAYFEDVISLGDHLEGIAGFRLSLFGEEDQLFINPEPRLGLNIRAGKQLSMHVFGSRMVQYLHLIPNTAIRFPNDLWLPSGEFLRPSDAWSAEAGLNWELSRYCNLSVDGYLKRFQNLPAFSDSLPSLSAVNIATPDSFLVTGQGVAKGLEFSFTLNHPRVQALVSYTLSSATRQFDSLNLGVRFPQDFDRRHQASVTAGVILNAKLSVNTTWIWMSGNPRLGISLPLDGIGFTNSQLYGPGEKNSSRTPDYHRLDANIRYQFRTGRLNHQLQAGVFNAYNRRNIAIYQSLGGQLTGRTSMGISPQFSYRLNF